MTAFEEFERLSRSYNVIPLARPMLADMHTPVSTYLTMREGASASFLLESVEPNEKVGRYSFVGINPVLTIRARNGTISVRNGVSESTGRRSVFEALKEMSSRYRQAPPVLLQDTRDPVAHERAPAFPGGFVGYLGYGNVSSLESIPLEPPGPTDEDDAVFGLFPSVVMFDHRHQLITILHNVFLAPGVPLQRCYEEGRKAVDALELRLRKAAVTAQTFRCEPVHLLDERDRAGFCAAVSRAKDYIVEGDIFQVVLSRRMRLPFSGDLFAVYRALRVINPSPYLFYIDFGETKLVGSSPEVLVRLNSSRVELLPIAGTRKRGSTDDEDLLLERELLGDEKELAEHVMLVDLGRNDVGRISEYGSVSVPVFKRVERFSHVMHLVSEIHGTLKEGADAVDVLKACFPAGTVSGAPKVRAMEIINELEPVRRGAYAGAVGYLGLNGGLDTCIAIRTIIAHRNVLSIQAGAGIVADSVPDREYQETASKARALVDAIAMAAGGLIPVHLNGRGREEMQ